jgi:hypothetical protein
MWYGELNYEEVFLDAPNVRPQGNLAKFCEKPDVKSRKI